MSSPSLICFNSDYCVPQLVFIGLRTSTSQLPQCGSCTCRLRSCPGFVWSLVQDALDLGHEMYYKMCVRRCAGTAVVERPSGAQGNRDRGVQQM
jgi:hypothetical protein